MYKIVVLGSGNVAEHLLEAFSRSSNSKVIQLYSRNEASAKYLCERYGIDYSNSTDTLAGADLYIIAVSDSAISELSSQINLENKLVAHTSGATDISAIDPKNRQAVFYPLQTFTKGKKINFRDIPLCLETKNAGDYKTIKDIGLSISEKVYNLSSEQRKHLHVAAVFVNNFTNHMFYIGKEISEHYGLDFDILMPIIRETVDKLESRQPYDSQTGPAVRGDEKTIQKHLELIPDKHYREIYRIISDSIYKTHRDK